MSWGAVIQVGGALLGGAISSSGSTSAANSQVAAGDRAILAQERALSQARSDLEPFRNLGGEALSPLLSFALDGPETELERTRGFEDIQRSAAAGGKLQSGGTLESLTSFNNQLNARNRNQRFSELFNLATLGSNAASGQATSTLNTATNVGNTIIGQGNARAAGRVGSANAASDSLFDLARIFGGS